MTENRSSRIEALFLSYRESLPSLVIELDGMWSPLNQQWDDELASEFARKVHGLAGSAATFDLAVIGDAARELEHAFMPLLDTQADTERLASVAKLFTQLKKIIQSQGIND